MVPKSRDCSFIVTLARIRPKELNGLIPNQPLKHSLRVRGGKVKILEGISGFEVDLNIKDTGFSKSTSLVSPFVQELNTCPWRWSM